MSSLDLTLFVNSIVALWPTLTFRKLKTCVGERSITPALWYERGVYGVQHLTVHCGWWKWAFAVDVNA